MTTTLREHLFMLIFLTIIALVGFSYVPTIATYLSTVLSKPVTAVERVKVGL